MDASERLNSPTTTQISAPVYGALAAEVFGMPTVDSVDLDYMLEGNMMILWGFPIQQHRNGGDTGQRYIGYGWDVKT